MNMQKRTMVVAIMLGVALLAGCQTKRAKTPPASTENVAVPADASANTAPDAGAAGAAIESAGTVGTDAAAGGGPTGEFGSRRLLYFAFDSDQIRTEDQPIVAAHAQFLAANPNARVRLEGHTDERGTREYNIALGERRAQAVRRALALQGATDAQSTAVSFGEERPAAVGEDEAAFSQNRRVEIIYGN
jgi:peptidoglycan-associated lipoprotein